MIKQVVYAFLSVILLIFYLELAAGLFVITVALSQVFIMVNAPLEGSIILLLSNIIVLLLILRKLQKNIAKGDWEPFKSNNLTYEITTPPKSVNPIINVTFIATYELMGRVHEKKVAIVKNQVYRQKITKLLDDKLIKNPIQAILYKKPRSDSTEVIYRNTFSITNIIIVALLVPIHLGFLFTSLILYGEATLSPDFTQPQLLNKLQHGSMGYIYVLSVVVLLLYIIYIIRGIRKTGVRGFRNYPMLYDVSSGLEEDFIQSLYRMTDICENCGEILEIREKYCSSCGQKVPKRKYYHVYDDPQTEEEESSMVLMQQELFDH